MHPRSLRVLAALFAASASCLPFTLVPVRFVRQAAQLADVPMPVPLDWLLRLPGLPFVHGLAHGAFGAGLLYALTRLARERGLELRNSPRFAAETFVTPVVSWFGPYDHLRAIAGGASCLGPRSCATSVVTTAQVLRILHTVFLFGGVIWPTLLLAMAGVTVAWALAWAFAAVRIADALEALPVRDTPEYFEGVADVSLPAPAGA